MDLPPTLVKNHKEAADTDTGFSHVSVFQVIFTLNLPNRKKQKVSEIFFFYFFFILFLVKLEIIHLSLSKNRLVDIYPKSKAVFSLKHHQNKLDC